MPSHPAHQNRRVLTRSWNLSTGKELSFAEPFNRLAFSSHARFVLTISSANGDSARSEPAMVHDLQTGRAIGPGLRLPRSGFDRVVLSPDGQSVLLVDEVTRQVRLYSVREGRCTLVRPLGVNSHAVAFSPAGDRVAIRNTAQGLAGIVEVRAAATGRLVAAPFPTPSWAEHVDFSADGRRLVVQSGSSVRLFDVDTGLALGPWLSVTSSGSAHTELPPNDYSLAANANVLLTRADWPKGYLRTSRFHVWELKPDARSVADLEALSELHAGRRLSETGVVAALSLDEYRRRWQAARAGHPEWFAPQAPALPEKVPTPPQPKKTAKPKLPRPVQVPDYAGVLARSGSTDRPPLVSVAAALQEKDASLRRAALDAVMGLRLDRQLALALLMEALKDADVRNWAIDQLGALGREAAPATSALVAELSLARKYDDSSVVRVARALGHIGPAAAAAVGALRDLVASIPADMHTDQDVEAARALGRIGPAARAAIPELVNLLLKEPWGNNQAVVSRALERISVGSEGEMVQRLEEVLRRTPALPSNRVDGSDPRIVLVEMIGRLGPKARSAAAALRNVMAEPPPAGIPGDLLRPAAAEALWSVEGRADDALAALIAGLKEPFPVRSSGDAGRSSRQGRAAAALGRIGAPAQAALPALRTQLSKGWNLPDRLDAAEALWRLSGDAKPILPLLIEVLQGKLEGDRPDKSLHVRSIAVLALMGAAARDAAPPLAAAIRAEDAINARQTFRFRILEKDEEDEDPDQQELLRRTGLPVLRKLDPATAQALETPAKAP